MLAIAAAVSMSRPAGVAHQAVRIACSVRVRALARPEHGVSDRDIDNIDTEGVHDASGVQTRNDRVRLWPRQITAAQLRV